MKTTLALILAAAFLTGLSCSGKYARSEKQAGTYGTRRIYLECIKSPDKALIKALLKRDYEVNCPGISEKQLNIKIDSLYSELLEQYNGNIPRKVYINVPTQ
jgi:hypothetical protein